jgi:hypothetical protein
MNNNENSYTVHLFDFDPSLTPKSGQKKITHS